MAFTSGPNMMRPAKPRKAVRRFPTRHPRDQALFELRMAGWSRGAQSDEEATGCVPDGNPSGVDYRSPALNGSRLALVLKRRRGDETAELIANLIGVNALSEGEIRNVLSILRNCIRKTGNPRARDELPEPGH